MPDDPAPIPEIPEGSEVYTIYISLTAETDTGRFAYLQVNKKPKPR
jgi:hypothetical protein